MPTSVSRSRHIPDHLVWLLPRICSTAFDESRLTGIITESYIYFYAFFTNRKIEDLGMLHVLIAGGGIGGLTTALCLHQAGIKATVFESSRM